jgi:predicted enzyme related to lactoylglutathione lyase
MLFTLLCACSGTTSLSEGFSLSEQPLIGKIVWHDLMTENPAAAQAFYAEILGWSFVTTERPNGGPYILARSGQRFVAGILEVADPPDGAEYSRWLGYLSVRDVDEAVALTISEGGTSVLARAARVCSPHEK